MYLCSFVEELCSPLLLHGRLLNDPFIKVRNVPDKFLLYGEHSQSIETILRHGVSQEGLDPIQSAEAPLRLSRCHGCRHEALVKTDTL